MAASKRTIRDFSFTGDLWSIVDSWAVQNGYKQQQADATRRLYQKGTGFLVAPMMLELRHDAGQVHLEAWTRFNLFVRITSLFMLPDEMGIESGGFRAVVPRNIARGAVNKLLPQLGQTEIP